MANRHPEDAQLFHKLTEDGFTVPDKIWSFIYLSIEDAISVVRVKLTLSIEKQQPFSVKRIPELETSIRDVYGVFKKLLHPEIIKTEDNKFQIIKQHNITLHPAFCELLNHYIGNDVNIINFVLGVNKEEESDLPIEDCKKIINCTKSMEEFLNRLKKHTETLEEKIRNLLTSPLVHLANLKEKVNEEEKEKILKCMGSLEAIVNLLDKN